MSENTEALAEIIRREHARAIFRQRPEDCWDAAADAVLAAGYRKPRTVSTVEDLQGLPPHTIIRAVTTRNPIFGDVFERFLAGWLHLEPGDREDGESTIPSENVLKWYGSKSVTVLYNPEGTAS